MDAEERVDDLIVDVIDATHGSDANMYPVLGVVAYDGEGEQQFGRTAVLPDMPDGALEAVMTTMLWNYIELNGCSWEEAAELVGDILAKAHYTFRQESAEGEAPAGEPLEVYPPAFAVAAAGFLEELSRTAPGMRAVASGVWTDGETGFTNAAVGPEISAPEWSAMLKALLNPVVREGHMTADELRAVLDDVFATVVLEGSRPKPLLS